jgi:hypothetical protein
METIFDIKQKQDSPEKLEAVAGIPDRFYIRADEFNEVTHQAVQSAVENVKIDLFWSNKPEHIKQNFNGISTVQQLVLRFHDEWMLKNTDEVCLLIDRYKSKRTIRTGRKFKESGFKHNIFPDFQNPNRPSEILIKTRETILKMGQPFYFHKIENTKSEIRTCGAGGKNHTLDKNRAWLYLGFRIRVKKGDKTYFSKSLATIQMICNRSYNDGKSQKISISYKLI